MLKLSIIVPVYNAEAYLCECLDSILRQTYQDYEIICVDDGSTDNSLFLMQTYAQKDHRIRIFSQRNAGLIPARKAGIAMARGSYTAFVDADDWIDANMYEVMMEKALEYKADIVTSGCVLEYSSGSITEVERLEEGIYEGNRLSEHFYPNMIGTDEFFEQNISVHVWNKLYKTELIRQNIEVIPDEITIGEDAACVYPSLLDAEKIMVMHEAFYHYRMTDMSMMGRSIQYIESYRIMYRYLKQRFAQYPYAFLGLQLKLLTIYELLLIAPEQLWQGQEAFPYNGVDKGSRVVLYGMGRFGRLLQQKLEKSGWCKIVAIVDQNKKKDGEGIRYYTLEEFADAGIDYDSILISVLKRSICQEVREEMIKNGVPNEKIKEPDIMAVKGYELGF